MHSRIFQIETRPVPLEERITGDMIPEWFTESVAYYAVTTSEKDRKENIEWLMESIGKCCTRDGDQIRFNIDVGSFFEGKYEAFKKIAAELSEVVFDKFVTGLDVDILVYRLEKLYSDKYGFYISQDDELYTLDTWMRSVQPCEIYYIGGIVDYHF